VEEGIAIFHDFLNLRYLLFFPRFVRIFSQQVFKQVLYFQHYYFKKSQFFNFLSKISSYGACTKKSRSSDHLSHGITTLLVQTFKGSVKQLGTVHGFN